MQAQLPLKRTMKKTLALPIRDQAYQMYVRFPPIVVIGSFGQVKRMFTYNDIVRVKAGAPAGMRPGHKAWVIGITNDHERDGSHFEQFPAGTVYAVEFEDGAAQDIHETMLEPLDA